MIAARVDQPFARDIDARHRLDLGDRIIGLSGGKVAARAIEKGFDAATDSELRIFFYMPLEHAENLALQERCVTLVEAMRNANFTQYAKVHRDVIARFGRFPHRNAVLGRTSTPEELRFLAEGGFSA